MARIAGVDLPREKRLEIGLTYIYGIGQVTAGKFVLKQTSAQTSELKTLLMNKLQNFVIISNIT